MAELETLTAFLLLFLAGICQSVELTFELPDSAKECFFEMIEQGTDSTLEFQVRALILDASLQVSSVPTLLGCHGWSLRR